MIDVACIESLSVSNITVRERGKAANIKNPQRVTYFRIRADGCVNATGLLADWVVERGENAVIIELKGRHVEHGADQVIATAHRWKVDEGRCSVVAGIIVGKQTPAASTSMQIKRREFMKKFKGPLHVVPSNCSFDFDALMSFSGPHRTT